MGLLRCALCIYLYHPHYILYCIPFSIRPDRLHYFLFVCGLTSNFNADHLVIKTLINQAPFHSKPQTRADGSSVPCHPARDAPAHLLPILNSPSQGLTPHIIYTYADKLRQVEQS